MPPSRRQQVWDRAGGCGEYCQMPQAFDVLPFQLDHIRARKHRGPSTIANTALACLACNALKGPNAAGYDPLTDTLVPLFNPRTDDWNEHFRWRGPQLVGRSPVGRATIEVLGINGTDRIAHRRLLIQAGLFPLKRS
jgi:hypothetical protein